MVGVHTGGYAAEMVRLGSCWEMANQRLVGYSMSELSSATPCERRISSGLMTAYPNPAPEAISSNFGPETFGEPSVTEPGGGRLRVHRKRPFGVTPSDDHLVAGAFY